MHPFHDALLAAIADVYRAEEDPEGPRVANALLSTPQPTAVGPEAPCALDAMIRACLAGSDHSVAQATLAAMDVLPWGANPVGAQMTEEAAAICAVLTLLDPAGPIPSPDQRLGLLYQRPNSYYPLHTHDADETYVIVAGRALWTAGEDTRDRGPGEAIHHPSRMPHAFRTGPEGMVALWRWSGDINAESYAFIEETVPLTA
ncbi:dimethylsulfonioproprionate lyase family protein [Wenxinia marina]|uniref:Cupin domain protein n=1 Tax=Wenxinia marina DSM 24838 TaxID=1123501 RepID=A0A0D0QEK7_9RHOB|nr:dimethylsulfonioproprionate lyase family protein [Wenxinia marina]KIQ70767.1 Cupin domain protein [Wenxinia marina DSM 24838]GGL80310.1 hypothetical protein GCM10011392_38620 [Wenxinia marina]